MEKHHELIVFWQGREKAADWYYLLIFSCLRMKSQDGMRKETFYLPASDIVRICWNARGSMRRWQLEREEERVGINSRKVNVGPGFGVQG